MLNFFRKHQKIFFFFVTVFVVISFAFFGAFKTYLPTSQVEDRVVCKAIDGSIILERELSAITRILATDTKKAGLPNILHGDLLERIFLQAGLGTSIATHFFPLIKEDLEERLQKMRTYEFYINVEAPFISAREIWTRFAPKVGEMLKEVQNKQEATSETFSLLSTLYREQKALSPDFVKKMLLYQQNQYSWIRPDPTLEQRNLALFGFETPRDWFGQTFLDLLSQCIVNGAAVAKEKGYRVSKEEARGDLVHNVINGVEAAYGKKISVKEACHYLRQEAQLLGMEEKTAVAAWQKVVLFCRLLEGATETIFQDPLLYDNFSAFANETAQIELYELSQELHLSNFCDLVKFQVYLEKREPEYWNRLDLPDELLSARQVEQTCPELVEERLHLEFSQVNVKDLSLSVPLRTTWEWEGEETNWALLSQEFPLVGKAITATFEERLAVLDALEESERFDIDQFARENIVKNDPEMLKTAFAEATLQKEWVAFRMEGYAPLPFKGIKDTATLLKRLQENECVDSYTEDGVHYITLHVLEREGEKKVLPFSKAKTDSAFAAVVDRTLEAHYKKMRENEPGRFQTKNGSFKPLDEVRDEVGMSLLAPLLRALEKEENAPEGKLSFEYYSSHRFAPFVRKIKARLEKGEDVSKWIESTSPFQLKKRDLDVTRSKTEGFDPEELFSLPEDAWSNLHIPPHGALAFYHLLSFGKATQERLASLNDKGKTLLADELKRELFEELTERFKKQDVIFVIKKEDE